jgi:hypothetical protein
MKAYRTLKGAESAPPFHESETDSSITIKDGYNFTDKSHPGKKLRTRVEPGKKKTGLKKSPALKFNLWT